MRDKPKGSLANSGSVSTDDTSRLPKAMPRKYDGHNLGYCIGSIDSTQQAGQRA